MLLPILIMRLLLLSILTYGKSGLSALTGLSLSCLDVESESISPPAHYLIGKRADARNLFKVDNYVKMLQFELQHRRQIINEDPVYIWIVFKDWMCPFVYQPRDMRVFVKI